MVVRKKKNGARVGRKPTGKAKIGYRHIRFRPEDNERLARYLVEKKIGPFSPWAERLLLNLIAEPQPA